MELIVDSVSHDFGELAVLRDVSFRVAPGEILALVGPSGCGKSTLLGIIGGLLKPQAGSVATAGAPPDGSFNPLTFVFQDFALLPWRSVADNVGFVLEHVRIRVADRRAIVADALRRTGLAEFAHSYPKQLSGGMRQRVGIARALAARPEILLMDEPFSALDALTAISLREETLDIWQAPDSPVHTILLVTHIIEEAIELADRVLVLSAGPGRLLADLKVDLPRPRDRRSDAFNALTDKVFSLIEERA